MRVKVSNPSLLPDLAQHLRECGCVAEQASANELDVYAPETANPAAARMEVDVYIAAWRVSHEGVDVEIVGD
jgi:hypothetical protein